MLEDLSPALVKQLSEYVRGEQRTKSPVTRGGLMESRAMERFKDWLEMQDIPVPILRTRSGVAEGKGKRGRRVSQGLGSAGASPVLSPRVVSGLPAITPISTPVCAPGTLSGTTSTSVGQQSTVNPTNVDDNGVFMMDDVSGDEIPPISVVSSGRGNGVNHSPNAEGMGGVYNAWRAKVAQTPPRFVSVYFG